MIKKLFLAVMVAFPMMMSAQSVKLGTVNSTEIFNMMPEKAVAEQTLQTLADKYKAESTTLENEFNQKYTDFQALDPSTPKTIKERRMQELQENQVKIQNFQKMASQDLKDQEAKLLAPVNQKLNDAIKAVGSMGGFTMIYDISDAKVPYCDASVEDVTPLVKKQLGIIHPVTEPVAQ